MTRPRAKGRPDRIDLALLAHDRLEDLDSRLKRVAKGKSSVADVHRLRATCRRLETLFSAFMPGSGRGHRRVAAGLRAIRRVRKRAGAVRDADVARKIIGAVAATPAGASMGDALATVDRYLANERKRAFRRLRRSADRKRAQRLRVQLREALREIKVERSQVERALRLFVGRARRLAAKRAPTAMAQHQARLAVKRVRDLADFLTPVLGRGTARLATRSARLSDQLGVCQDLFVLIDRIEAAAVGSHEASLSLARLRRLMDTRAQRALERSARLLKAVAGSKAVFDSRVGKSRGATS